MPRFRVVVDWTNDLTSDSDEMQVWAKTAAGATSKARSYWAKKTLSKWRAKGDTSLRLEGVWVLTRKRSMKFT